MTTNRLPKMAAVSRLTIFWLTPRKMKGCHTIQCEKDSFCPTNIQ